MDDNINLIWKFKLVFEKNFKICDNLINLIWKFNKYDLKWLFICVYFGLIMKIYELEILFIKIFK